MGWVQSHIRLMTSSLYTVVYAESFCHSCVVFIVALGNHLREMALSIIIGIRGQQLSQISKPKGTAVEENRGGSHKKAKSID